MTLVNPLALRSSGLDSVFCQPFTRRSNVDRMNSVHMPTLSAIPNFKDSQHSFVILLVGHENLWIEQHLKKRLSVLIF